MRHALCWGWPGRLLRLKLVATFVLCSALVRAQETPASGASLADILHASATELRDIRDLDPLLDQMGSVRYALLGEASHGTSEYYLWRAHLSRRLIEEKDFSFVAVEGDWPSLQRLDRYVRGQGTDESAFEALYALERWPTWMWANWEVVAFAEWLKEHNMGLPEAQRVGFYGLDLYSLWESLEAVLDYLEREAPSLGEVAERVQACFAPYQADETAYARATAAGMSCEAEATALYQAFLTLGDSSGTEEHFSAEQNALVVLNAERYYRALAVGGPESWNIRDRHMLESLDRLMAHHESRRGSAAKAIVWEHNTHIGDARATPMAEEGMVNLGQLVREKHGEHEAYLVGFGSYQGSVIAAQSWGGVTERMEVPTARAGSWEALFHDVSPQDRLLLLRELEAFDAALQALGHRAIGVIYHPEAEGFNYVPTVLPRRYDAFIYLDKTEALRPLHDEIRGAQPPSLYPWGF